MSFLKNHCDKVIKYDFINKYNLNSVVKIPVLKKIIISFNIVAYSKKKMLCCMLAIKLLTNHDCLILQSKKHNLRLKIKKGVPIACMVVLRKKQLKIFLENFIFNIMINFKSNIFVLRNKNFLSFTIPKTFLINEFNSHYLFFKDLLDLNVTFVSDTKNILELTFLLNSFNIFVKSSVK